MFDLVSTRPGVDPETRGCARLLAAIIARAISDACRKLTAEEAAYYRATQRSGKHDPASDMPMEATARRAIHFLFARRSVFGLYASLMGADAACMRRALLDAQPTHQLAGTAAALDDALAADDPALQQPRSTPPGVFGHDVDAAGLRRLRLRLRSARRWGLLDVDAPPPPADDEDGADTRPAQLAEA